MPAGLPMDPRRDVRAAAVPVQVILGGYELAKRPVIGLDIGNGSVRAAEVDVSRGAPTIRRFGMVQLAPGAVRGGEVMDAGAVTAALRHLWKSAGFKSRSVAIGLANQRVLVRQVDVPWMEAGEVKQALTFQVQDSIPIPVEEALLDYYPISEFTNESGARMRRIMLVAVTRDMVSNEIAAVRAAGLTPVLVDLDSFALLRACAQVDHLGVETPRVEAIVDVGADLTNIVVHTNGVPAFVRLLPAGGNDLTEAVADRLGVPLAEAEEQKRTMALGTGQSAGNGYPAAAALTAAAETLVDGIRGSLDYYQSQPQSAIVSRVVLTGGGGRLAGLDAMLAESVNVPVEAAPSFPFQDALVSPVTVGLAMGAAA